MRYSLLLLVLCLLTCSCASHARLPGELSTEEAAALAFLKKDPFMRISRIEREDEGQLLVTSQQGNQKVRYRITADKNKTAKDMIQKIPLHVVYRENF